MIASMETSQFLFGNFEATSREGSLEILEKWKWSKVFDNI